MNDFLSHWRLTPQLSLHQLTALDATPLALIDIAHALGCSHVCLFTHVPDAARGRYPLVSAEDAPAILAACARTGVALSNLEVFPLDGATDPAAFEPGLATGAALGAPRATVHIHDATFEEAVARFTAFCDQAARHGIDAGLEFNAFSAVKDIASAEAIVRAAARPNARLVLDCLHLARSGGTAGQVAGAADLIDFVQLCDGPAEVAEDQRFREAVTERALPGRGSFALAEILAVLRPGTLIDVEVPQTGARKAGASALDRARAAVDASRTLFKGA